MRRARIEAERAAIEPYLPGNYYVNYTVHRVHPTVETYTIIEGEDVAGWTLDDYVLPRLASGLIFGREIDAAHYEEIEPCR